MTTAQNFRRLLFVRTDRLGETLLNLPAIAALHEALPEASISLLVHPELAALLAHVTGVDRVLACRMGSRHLWWAQAARIAWQLRRFRFDAAFVSNPARTLHLAVWLAGIPCRVGYDRKWGWALTHRLPDRKALGGRHEVEYNFDLLRSLHLPTVAPDWRLPRFDRERRQVWPLLEPQGLTAGRPFLAVHPWSSNPLKQWPAGRFRELIARLAGELHVGVVVIGSPEAAPDAERVLPPGAVGVVNLVGRLDLPQLASLLQDSRLLVSNDSGPVHLAAAVGTPAVALFGTSEAATGPGRWGPWGEGHTVIVKPSMDAITVDDVLTAVRQQLEKSSPIPR